MYVKTDTEHINDLQKKFGKYNILKFPFPKPFFETNTNINAILLGCDPTNKHSHELPYAFAIKSGLPVFQSFINGWNRNLLLVGLSFKDVYIQNLCKNYFTVETTKNKIWNNVAEYWIPYLKEELCLIPSSIPVLLSSEKLYLVLLNPSEIKHRAYEFYDCKIDFIIKPECNKLQRPLIPFYRHYKYKINNFDKYKNCLKKYLSSIKHYQ